MSRHFFQEWNANDQHINENIHKIINIREMQIKSQWDAISTQVKLLSFKYEKIMNATEDIEEKVPDYTSGGNRDWYMRCGNQFAEVSEI